MVLFMSANNTSMNAMEKSDIISFDTTNYKIAFQQQFKSRQSCIPLFSFDAVWRGYNKLDSKKKKYVHHNVSSSLSFSFALCPKEIRHKVLTSMLDNDSASAEEFDTKPIIAAFEHYNYVKAYACLKISNKKYSAGRLFRLSPQEIIAISSLWQPFTYFDKIIGSDSSIVSKKTLKILRTMPADITQNLKIRVIEDEYEEGRFFSQIATCGISSLAYSLLPCSAAIGITCCCEGFRYLLHYHWISLDAEELEL